MRFQTNPHDELAPSMSTLIITAHVKEGVTLALQHKLPKPIIDAIQQHHGTSLLSYFFHRANEQHKQKADSQAPAEESFRYPGPKPQTREMAILSLADSVEAASRSIEKPAPNRIENLVRDIVQSRLNDGQLDACDLTLAELDAIKKSFVFTLTNMLHGRVAYPKHDDRNKQSAEKASGQHSKPDGTGSIPV